MHKSVLLNQVIEGLDLKPGEVLLDGTLGSGGHSLAAAESTGGKLTIIGLDRDPEALQRSAKRLEGTGAKCFLVEANFRDMGTVLAEMKISEVDAVLLDLGLSSDQIDAPTGGGVGNRGFSFLRDEPLDMRMGREGITAADVVNSFDEETLELVIRGFGEERFSRSIAKRIVERREEKPFETTRELVEAIESAVPASYRRGRIHPATRTFQAIRIAVNEELASLEQGLAEAWKHTKPGGRIAVISFHSLEDRIVKNFFRDRVKEGEAKVLTKKPIVANEEEVRENPRSRSAKLRIAEKL